MKTLTFSEHVEAGRRIKQIGRLLTELETALPNGLGKTSRAAKLIRQTAAKFGELRTELDNVISVQCPGVENAQLNRVYYGSSEPFQQTATSGKGGDQI